MPASESPPELEPAIHRAARRGETAELDSLLRGGADVNARWDLRRGCGPFFMGLTPLHVAAASHDGASVETVRWLLSHGADLRARSSAGVTAAWYAAGGDVNCESRSGAGPTSDIAERLRLFLDAGLDPNETAGNGRSLLVEACRAGDPARVRMLLERGAAASPAPKEGGIQSFQIPLFCAAESGSAQCVQPLIDAGVDPNTLDETGATALFVAASPDAAHVLIGAGVDVSAEDTWGNDAPQEHLQKSDQRAAPARLAVARTIAACGVDLERRDKYGHTCLYGCAFHRAANAVELLLELGADPQARQGGSRTPLHAVAWQGESSSEPELNLACARTMDLLVTAGVSVDARNDRGKTPLHEAVSGDWGSPSAVRALLHHGAEVDPVDSDGCTPLMLAVSGSELECVRLLLEAGADATAALDEAHETLQMCRELSIENPGLHAESLADAETCLKLIRDAAGGSGC